MKTRLIDIGSVTPDDELRWRELSARAAEPNPFHEPDFLGLSARHFDGYAHTRLVVTEDGESWRALLPIIGTSRPNNPPRPMASTRGRPTAVGGTSTPLVDRNHVDTAVDALLSGLSAAARQHALPGVVVFEDLGADGPVGTAIRRQVAARGLPTFTRPPWVRGSVSRHGQMDNPVPHRRRRENDRLCRLITKERGEGVRVVDRSQDPAAAEDFLTLEASGWKGTGKGSAFARSDFTASWFREWYQRWSVAGRLIMLSLEAGTVSIAMQCFVRAGEGMFWIRTAFDEDYRRYAPGALLLAAAMEHVRDTTDVEWIDSNSDPDNIFVLAMFPERLTASTLFVGTGGMLDRRSVAAMPAITKLSQARREAHRRWAQRVEDRRAH